ncbi:MAG: hypothetical protein A2W61_03825 [Deltaproteobacteria bacterium RIFCSPLOWO2_01_44_7]|nr:MAG: hypothetical protein A2712_07745 [Deltaproteobacteria bacterium RIFCSPHIGHO2_01_FULL_43_49]OGQ14766.1 MAG: hypothetical protein A3D22_09250 [Deltaproteobacteria bacterium RIFCSPHIGHO2_02_FULL_44_53]OGQ28152.1 MAG: hypothetical protein A3D98_07960 [Deltaproteobacteria bacterium RIFCSPHIGHO2_12_FULL_44_21]OGQ31364.1 MAG: hypothetical protein A2979_08010 [Deltaproteobacteria bacterium RIFCSPLOWO2_01_FULL_45_74]OGQ38640.1 MAG: hypothetical protein A2W61_03825 [Deltaproteobacteria bacterium 
MKKNRMVAKKWQGLSLRVSVGTPNKTPQQTLRATHHFFTAILITTLSLTSLSFAKPISEGTVKITVSDDALFFDEFKMTFQRTLRIPDDGKQYPLPPGLGKFPIYRVEDYASKLPKEWVAKGGVFIPMHQKEAMWISFGGEEWRPRALKIGVGKVNALTGETWDPELKKLKDQDYLVAPTPQPWIDGIKSGKDFIRQFVAMPLGKGVTVEGQVTGEEKEGGLQIAVYNPVKGKFKKPAEENRRAAKTFGLGQEMPSVLYSTTGEGGMGLGAGGKMRQKIYPDPYGFDTWDKNKFASINIFIVNSKQFQKITGKKPPDTPITKKEYELYGYPWFDLYDEQYADIKAQKKLKDVKSVNQLEKKKDESIKVKKTIKYKTPEKATTKEN